MKRLVSLSLLVLLVLGLAGPAESQGPGLFIRTDCTTLTGPVTGQTWCFDATAQIPKVWNGSAYVNPTPGVLTKGTDLASSATLSLSATANFYHVTGTTTITALSTAAAGILVVLEFDGILTLTHNATSLILPNNGSNITTAATDTAVFVSEGGGNWRCVAYQKGSGGGGELFGTGSSGAITDNGGGTVTRNGILNATTYSLGSSVATTLAHAAARALHIKASTSITIGANGTIGLNSLGGAGGAAGTGAAIMGGAGGNGIVGGGGGGSSGVEANDYGGNGGGLGFGAGAVQITVGTGGFAGKTAVAMGWLTDMGFTATLVGPGGGGGGGSGSGSGNGGAGGAGGGVIVLESPAITLTAGYSMTATGANGSNSAATASGAGGGGGGGMFVQRRRTLTGTFAATTTGGTGGTTGGTGGAGGNGATGGTIDEVLP